jgi:hypothetical protein
MGNALLAQVSRDVANADIDLVDDFVVGRIAPEEGVTRSDVLRDLTPYLSHRLSPSEIREAIDTCLDGLESAGMVCATRGRYRLTGEGIAKAQQLFGGRTLPKDWPEIRDILLPARALGLNDESAQRIKTLARPDGLRAAILQKTYGIKGKRAPSAARLRSALAGIALERAFGNKIKGDIAVGDGLSARAGRLLAAQLCQRPRDYGTDSRLIAALAAEAIGAVRSDLTTLRTTVLRSAISSRLPALNTPTIVATEPPVKVAPKRAPRRTIERHPDLFDFLANEDANAAPIAARPTAGRGPVRPAAASRPDLAGFVRAVLAAAEPDSEGWPGNRKTLIVRVWGRISAAHPEWGLNEIEFKAMLTEAHRTGHIVLANADLKTKDNAREIQASAISFKNTVWHFVRIES